jgi:hypothetical protein
LGYSFRSRKHPGFTKVKESHTPLNPFRLNLSVKRDEGCPDKREVPIFFPQVKSLILLARSPLRFFLIRIFLPSLTGGGIGFLGIQPIFLIGPGPQIDHLAALAAKGAVGIALIGGSFFAPWTGDFHGFDHFFNFNPFLSQK